MRLIHLLTFCVALAVTLAAGQSSAGASTPATANAPTYTDVPKRDANLAIVGVTVIPMDEERQLSGQTVLVADGRIVRIGSAGTVKVPRGARRIDGTGRFLIPGLADMHVHLAGPADLTLNVAYGVTFVRAMWGDTPIVKMREDVRAGRLLGPRILVGSRIVDGSPVLGFGSYSVVSEADAARVVHEIKAGGYDFVKVYSNLSLRLRCDRRGRAAGWNPIRGTRANRGATGTCVRGRPGLGRTSDGISCRRQARRFPL